MSDTKKVEDLTSIDLNNIKSGNSIFFIKNQGYCFITKTHIFATSINRKKYPVKNLTIPKNCDLIFFQNIRKKGSSDLMLDIITNGSEYLFLKYLYNAGFTPEFFTSNSKMMRILKYKDWIHDMHFLKGNNFSAIFIEVVDEQGNLDLKLIRYHYNYKCNFSNFKNKIENLRKEFWKQNTINC